MAAFNALFALAGRILLSFMFVLAGFSKIGGYAGTQQYMESAGLPGELLPLVILTELGGGILVVLGLFTRWAALALAGFCVLSAFLFHFQPDDQMQMISLQKNLGLAGGFLLLTAFGPGAWSFDEGWRRG
ncbi:DoxX family protein [Afifella pfennigii]|uniref:DoxX family protein n=1 Tax=Afifella pfennigii TaxID=209897 RepID=UPI00047E53FE|nr:DoxX family protein [Afifella pfennigii]